MTSIRTLYIGQKQFFQAITRVLQSSKDIELLDCATHKNSPMQLCHEQKPHLILLEVADEPHSLIPLIRELRRHCPQPRIIIFATSVDVEQVRLLLQNGVNGYLLKPFALEGLETTIRLVNSGNLALSPEITRALFA